MRLFVTAILLLLSVSESGAQDDRNTKVAAFAYADYTTDGLTPVMWASYDYNKFSIEGRYNYDWDNTASFYLGAALKHNEWKLRLMQGITAGNGNASVGISPLAIYDGSKVFLYNSPQLNVSISKMPTFFFHWGEAYYKASDSFWFGASDRLYYDSQASDRSFGPVASVAYKEVFLNFYYWIPTSSTQNKFSVLLGFERESPKGKR